MDDKAYLRPGTDVGARATKTGVIYDVIDPEEEKKLPQHDFNHPEVNQTPASFRFIKQHILTIDGKDELISDKDQSVVVIRPKHYIGSNSTVWASDYMYLCHEFSKRILITAGAICLKDLLFIHTMLCFTSLTLH